VAAGLAAAPDAEWYLVHDAARPLASAALCANVLAAARVHGAAIPALPVADTIKRVDAEGLVTETLAREPLRAVQTPQAFAGTLLRRAHAQAQVTHTDATDDASLVEAIGAVVATVPGEAANLKVTTPGDLVLVQVLLAAVSKQEEH
jgi:2-C-methyl-D-erythritol 4-phosphate cytidylyltransferase